MAHSVLAYPLPRPVRGPLAVLTGPMAAGKTAVGRALAKLWGVRYRDTDDDVETAAGRPIPDIFAQEGESGFRDLEHQAVVAALATPLTPVDPAGPPRRPGTCRFAPQPLPEPRKRTQASSSLDLRRGGPPQAVAPGPTGREAAGFAARRTKAWPERTPPDQSDGAGAQPGGFVLGLGGGAVTRADTRAALRAYADGGGAVVLIEISEATAAARLGAGEGRPMLEGDPMARWRELMAARLDHYREVATLRVSGDGSGSPRHLAREIHRRLALSAIHRP